MKKLSANPAGEGEQEFEINIAAIIDCFTVLITYLLASASFLSVAVMDVTAAAPVAQAAPSKNATIDVAIDVYRNKRIRLQVIGEQTRNINISPTNDDWDFAVLNEHLKALKHDYPKLEVVVVSGESELPYEPLVKAVETAKNSVPAVSLGGESDR